jgi:hypothetical protein
MLATRVIECSISQQTRSAGRDPNFLLLARRERALRVTTGTKARMPHQAADSRTSVLLQSRSCHSVLLSAVIRADKC